MSYRKYWRHCKSKFPTCYALNMSDSKKDTWFRICADKGSTGKMEFYELGSGRTRYEAWKTAAGNSDSAYEYRNWQRKRIRVPASS